MLSHKFRIGQLVQLAPGRNVPGGSYEVIKKLPESRGEFEYRIKSMNEPSGSFGKASCKACSPLTLPDLLQFCTGLIQL
jgi:hypothetical protein